MTIGAYRCLDLHRHLKYGFAGAIMGLLLVGAAGPAGAAQDDERLSTMFDKLQLAETDLRAQRLEAQIWQIWLERDDKVSSNLIRDGSIAMSTRNYSVALSKFNELVEHDPEFAEAWNKRATLYYLMGDYDASVRDIERTLALEPRHFGALSGLGLIFMAIGNDAAAIASFEKALEINPHMPGPRYHVDMLKGRIAGSPT
jgi:tetratricopeptide (TPR) repeat protein